MRLRSELASSIRRLHASLFPLSFLFFPVRPQSHFCGGRKKRENFKSPNASGDFGKERVEKDCPFLPFYIFLPVEDTSRNLSLLFSRHLKKNRAVFQRSPTLFIILCSSSVFSFPFVKRKEGPSFHTIELKTIDLSLSFSFLRNEERSIFIAMCLQPPF